MACSFAVRNIVLIFCLLYSTLNRRCLAEKEFLFEKGNLYKNKLKIEHIGPGMGWIKSGTAIGSCSELQENWFYVTYIDAGNATNVYMDIEYSSKSRCNDSGCGLFVRIHRAEVGSNIDINKEVFKAESFSLAASKNKKVTNVHFDMEENKRYVTFAVQAKGVCAVVYNISMYYLYCPENISTSVTFHRTPAPNSGSIAVQGQCSKYSSNKNDTIVAYCTSNGTWENLRRQANHCRCSAGQELNNKTGECTRKVTKKPITKPITTALTKETSVSSDKTAKSNCKRGGIEWYIIVIALICGICIGMIFLYAMLSLRQKLKSNRDDSIPSVASSTPETRREGTQDNSLYQELELRNREPENSYQALRVNTRKIVSNETKIEDEACYQELDKVREDNDTYQSLNRV